ncbi:MAG: DUF2892 domain-containing protein [Mariprofundaceae bacterium]
MKANVGTIDRAIRALAGLALIAFGFAGGLAAPWNFVAMGVGAVFTLTAIIRFCPIYPILGMNTCGKKEA